MYSPYVFFGKGCPTVGRIRGVMNMPDRVIWEWLDDAGGFLRASNWINSSANLASVFTPLQQESNAQILYATSAPPVVSSSTPVSSQYHLVVDVAILTFATVPGVTFTVVIPGPLASTYGPSSNVVNPTDPFVAALIAAVLGTLTDVNGNVAVAYVSGIKSSRRTEQV
jgi:hypothetical protein